MGPIDEVTGARSPVLASMRGTYASAAINVKPEDSGLLPPAAQDRVRTVPERIRMLVVSSDTFPPTRVDVSVLFGEELAVRGHQIDWILQSEAHLAHGFATPWGGGTVWVTPVDRRPSLYSRLRKHMLGVWHDAMLFPLLRSGRYDLIEVKDKFLSGVLALVAARWYRKKFVFWLSYPFPEHYLTRARDGTAPYPLLYRLRGMAFAVLLYRILLPAADHVFVQSEQMRRDVHAHGIPLAKMTAVPMGVRIGHAALGGTAAETGASIDAPESINNGPPMGRRRRIPANHPSFLYLGSLGRERRIDFLLRVLQRVRQQSANAKLYLVGKAEYAEEEQFLVEEAGRLRVQDAVVFTGQLPQAEALEYVREANVCVSPFYTTPILNSTSPTKLVEYMLMGKAVVANEHPEQQLVIAESGAGYCVAYDEDAFAQAILALLRAPDLAREMGERGRRYVLERRSYQVIASQVERQLLQIVQASSA